MAKTFEKRSGTTNKGTDYEILNIANIAMDLVVDEGTKNFYMSSNDANFGAFDDIVVETELETGTETNALQLKHSDRGNLSLKQLANASGDFSIKKYFYSVQTLEIAKARFILFTNLKFKFVAGTKFYLDGEDFPVTFTKIPQSSAFKVSQKTDYCYKFSVVEDSCSYEYCPEVLLYKRFFENFYLYTDQLNMHNLKRHVNEKFKSSFSGNDKEFNEYVKFLNEWSLKEGTKEMLNRQWLRLAIALKVLSSRIKPLSFNNSDIQNTKSVGQKILREAIGAFDITIFRKESYDDVKNLWDDATCELRDLRIVNSFRTKYQLSPVYISEINRADSSTLTILLWLMGKVPLILTQDATVDKILQLCKGVKFILLKDGCVDSFSGSVGVFETVSDLKTNQSLYGQVVQNFKCSLQGKEEIPLEILVKDDEELLNVFTTDDLLEMCEGKCRIGEAREVLPNPYIERRLLKNAINIRILDNMTDETVIVLDCVSDKKAFKRYNLIHIDDLNPQRDQTSSSDTVFNFEPRSQMGFSNQTSVIYFCERLCEFSDFSAVYDKYNRAKHFHQFRFRDDGNLEWIRSTSEINFVEMHKLLRYYPVQERALDHSEFSNNLNLLIGDPGMGKSELMKSFKLKCFSESLTVIVDPKDVYSFLKNNRNGNYVEDFYKFLLDEKYRMLSERDKTIFANFLKKNKIIFVWDAMDELSEEHRDIVIDIIVSLSKDCFQWVTSRYHLQNLLQGKLNVMSLNLNKFDEEEQKSYIRDRLVDANPTEETETVIQKIESSFVLVEHRDILGIPLQIYMLTELFRQDREKYLALLDNFFILTDLYKYFIQEKINIHYKDKLGIDLSTASMEKLLQSQNDVLLEQYTSAALRVLFTDKILSMLKFQATSNFEKLQENHTNIGLVTEVKDQIPTFLHKSFAEYLAARHLANNIDNEILKEVMFDPNFVNVRFFFDLLLAGDSKPHVAILYQNFAFLRNCDGEVLRRSDSGRRSVLHLACSWGRMYPELNVVYLDDTCTVGDKGNPVLSRDNSGYLEAIDYLLECCDVCESDEIYCMTPEEYARRFTCLVPEMRIIMHRNFRGPIERGHLINMLYYSTFYNYYHELVYFFNIYLQLEPNVLSAAGRRKLKSCKVVDRVRNNLGRTLFSMAATLGHFEIVLFLVEAGADIHHRSHEGFTALISACANGHVNIVEFLISKGADINHADSKGITPLHAASSSDHANIVELLLKAGANINYRTIYGYTPLARTTLRGHYKTVKFLIAAGADVNIPENEGFTPLAIATTYDYGRIVKILTEAGAKESVDTSPNASVSGNEFDEIQETDTTRFNFAEWFERICCVLCRCQSGSYRLD